jgi:hypothetical protein
MMPLCSGILTSRCAFLPEKAVLLGRFLYGHTSSLLLAILVLCAQDLFSCHCCTHCKPDTMYAETKIESGALGWDWRSYHTCSWPRVVLPRKKMAPFSHGTMLIAFSTMRLTRRSILG